MRKILLLLVFITVSCKVTQKNDSDIIVKKQTKKKYTAIKIFEQEITKGLGPCEPSIYINPKNPDNIVAGSVIDFVHYSLDGGKTWTTNKIKSKLGIWGDPCIVADTKGTFYYFHLSDPEGKNWSSKHILDQMVVQKSIDNGKSWSTGTGIGKNTYPKQQDKEWATVNPFNDEIYLTWTEFDKYGSKDKKHRSRILFSKSSDAGETWTTPSALSEIEGNAIDNNGTVEGATTAVGIDGEIYCAWSVNDKIYLDKSLNDGKTWFEKDIIVTNQTGWGFDIEGLGRANGMPITAVDLSESAYKGTIYITFANQRNGKENTDVFLVKSVDRGKTFSTPIKVNTDATKTQQFFPWMSVDAKTGYIYIVYYDRSRYTNTQTDVVLAISKNGGKSFETQVISEKPFVPNKGVFFGDYNNIHAFNGRVRPIWTHYENGKLSVWTCLIDF